MSLPISCRTYADMYSPTTGELVRLGDTGLIDGKPDDAGKKQQAQEKFKSNKNLK